SDYAWAPEESRSTRLGVVRFFFFFQAEDGIRDFHVTGVQTCALPIWRRSWRSFMPPFSRRTRAAWHKATRAEPGCPRPGSRACRSEERRVGKECRFRWSPDH